MQREADRGRQRHREESGERERNARRGEKHGGEPADHDELALREIDHVGGVVDQGESQRDQGVDRPDGQPGKGELQELGHGLPDPLGLRIAVAAGAAAIKPAAPAPVRLTNRSRERASNRRS